MTPTEVASPSSAAVLLRVAGYLLTLLAAASALFVGPALMGAVERGALSPRWLFLPIGLFAACLLALGIDRFRLVNERRYPAGRAAFQIAFGVIFASLLLPGTIKDYQQVRPKGAPRLLLDADPEVRASQVFSLAYQALSGAGCPSQGAWARGRPLELIASRLDDRDPAVRAAALSVLSCASGLSDQDLTGIRAWASALSRTSTRTGREGKP